MYMKNIIYLRLVKSFYQEIIVHDLRFQYASLLLGMILYYLVCNFITLPQLDAQINPVEL